jgi:hypothetical protein
MKKKLINLFVNKSSISLSKWIYHKIIECRQLNYYLRMIKNLKKNIDLKFYMINF